MLLLARGGEGGQGNTRFATSVNKVPYLAEEGMSGEARRMVLELRMLAEVGLVGMPNSGKSLLLQQISNATPAVEAYPFTTQVPVLGVVEWDWRQALVVELPGIGSGASQGKGIGTAFLRHLWRVRLIVHLVDGSVADPITALREVNEEIWQYEPTFMDRPQLVVVTKVDLPSVRERLSALRKQLAPFGLARHFVSANTGEGVRELVAHIHKLLQEIPPVPSVPPREVEARPSELRHHHPAVSREGDVFVVSSPRAERLVRLPDLRQFQVRLQLRSELAKLGVVKALEEAGVQPGDWVRIGRTELQWE